MTNTAILAYAGFVRPEQLNYDLVHAYLRLPDDWREVGVPERRLGNALMVREPFSSIEIGDVFQIEQDDAEPPRLLRDTLRWTDTLGREFIREWKVRSREAAARSAPQRTPLDEAIGVVRAHYFESVDGDARDEWMRRITSLITKP